MINLDSRTKSKLTWAAMLLAPVIAVQGVRAVFGVSASPSSVSAAPVGPQPLAPGPGAADAAKPLSPAQSKAQAWMQARTRSLQPRSPMDRPDPIAAPTPETAVVEKPTPQLPPLQPMTLSAMIAGSSSGQPLALINHKVYRIGQSVTSLWKVSAIDTKKRTVTLTGPEGRSIELQPPTPSLER